MKKIKLLLAPLGILLALSSLSPGFVFGVGLLDPDFGNEGKVVVPGFEEYLLDAALLPDHRVVIIGPKQLLALLPSGEVDRGFGQWGQTQLSLPSGAKEASFSLVLTDSQGRIVVVGACDFAESSGVHNLVEGRDLPRQIMIQRYLPDGKLDPSFGTGGTVLTDFGLPPSGPGFAPRVFPHNAEIDGQDRILITGNYRAPASEEIFVGRLSAGGEDDPSFAQDGVYTPSGYEWVGRPVTDKQDGVFFITSRGPHKRVLIHLAETGEPDSGFGDNGGRPVSGTVGLGSLGIDAYGRITFFNQLFGQRGRLPNGFRIRRLLPDGTLDRVFAENAPAVRVPRLYDWQTRTDDQGRILLAMELKNTAKRDRPPGLPVALGLMRLRADGAPDRSFGAAGIVRIQFGGRSPEIHLVSLQVQGGEALLAGSRCVSRCQSALARIRLNPS